MRSHARRHLVAIVALLIGIGLAMGARRARPVDTSCEVDFSSVPLQVAGLQGRESPADEELAAYLEADRMRSVAYGEGADEVLLNIIYGASWRTVHTPAQCYPATGWKIVWKRASMLPEPDDLPHDPPLLATMMRVERGEQRQIVLFIFAHRGGTSADYAEHSWAVATGPRGAGGLSLLLSTPLEDGEAEAEALQLLMRIATGVYPDAVAFWYERE